MENRQAIQKSSNYRFQRNNTLQQLQRSISRKRRKSKQQKQRNDSKSYKYLRLNAQKKLQCSDIGKKSQTNQLDISIEDNLTINLPRKQTQPLMQMYTPQNARKLYNSGGQSNNKFFKNTSKIKQEDGEKVQEVELGILATTSQLTLGLDEGKSVQETMKNVLEMTDKFIQSLFMNMNMSTEHKQQSYKAYKNKKEQIYKKIKHLKSQKSQELRQPKSRMQSSGQSEPSTVLQKNYMQILVEQNKKLRSCIEMQIKKGQQKGDKLNQQDLREMMIKLDLKNKQIEEAKNIVYQYDPSIKDTVPQQNISNILTTLIDNLNKNVSTTVLQSKKSLQSHLSTIQKLQQKLKSLQSELDQSNSQTKRLQKQKISQRQVCRKQYNLLKGSLGKEIEEATQQMREKLTKLEAENTQLKQKQKKCKEEHQFELYHNLQQAFDSKQEAQARMVSYKQQVQSLRLKLEGIANLEQIKKQVQFFKQQYQNLKRDSELYQSRQIEFNSKERQLRERQQKIIQNQQNIKNQYNYISERKMDFQNSNYYIDKQKSQISHKKQYLEGFKRDLQLREKNIQELQNSINQKYKSKQEELRRQIMRCLRNQQILNQKIQQLLDQSDIKQQYKTYQLMQGQMEYHMQRMQLQYQIKMGQLELSYREKIAQLIKIFEEQKQQIRGQYEAREIIRPIYQQVMAEQQ